MNRGALVTLLLACLSACGLLPEHPDGGPVPVPGSYRLARFTPGHEFHLSLRGEQQLQCTSCHALGDAGFTSPGPQLCVNCHQLQATQHHPLDAQLQMTCFTCHPFTAEKIGQRFEKWRCLDCHREPQEGRPRIEVHAGQCASCHRPHTAPFTQSADCRECHDVTVKHGFKASTMAETCMACHPNHSKAPVASQQCKSCHETNDVPAVARVDPAALFTGGHVGCGSCHTAHTFTRTAVKPCSTCHAGKPVLSNETHTCTGCHRPHQPKAAAVACSTCHGDTQVQHPKTAAGQTCTGCHPPHAQASTAAKAVACTSCHDGQPFTGAVVHAQRLACASCHRPHGGKPKQPLCKSCHEEVFAKVAFNPGHQNCASCHAGLPHADMSAAPAACLSCHDGKTPPQPGHAQCLSCHELHSARVLKTCTQCHDATKLPGLHLVRRHAAVCTSCHGPHTPEPGVGPETCRACHRSLPKQSHPTPPQQCVSCHLFTRP